MDEINTTTIPAEQTTITEPATSVTPPPIDAPPFLIRKSPIIILGRSILNAFIGFGILVVIYLVLLVLNTFNEWSVNDIFMLGLLAFVIGTISFVISNDRVYYILSKDKLSYVAKKTITKVKDFALNQIRSVELQQDFWAKAFGYGTLQVTFFPESAKAQLINIAEPHMVKQAIEARGIKS